MKQIKLGFILFLILLGSIGCIQSSSNTICPCVVSEVKYPYVGSYYEVTVKGGLYGGLDDQSNVFTIMTREQHNIGDTLDFK